ncbi:MAG: DUF167 domain-containing protein [Pseudomonadota bacterium]
MANRKAAAPAQFSTIEGAAFIRVDKHGDIILDIQVIPNAARTQVDGLYGEGDQVALKIRLNAPPVDGKANDALIKWLASELGIARSSLEIVRGQTTRRKQLCLSAETAANANWKQLTKCLENPPGLPPPN